MAAEEEDVSVLYPEAAPPVEEAAEEHFQEGSVARGVLAAVLSLLGYVVAPLFVLNYLTRQLAVLVVPGMVEQSILVVGVLMAGVAFLVGYAAPESRMRHGARLVQTLLAALYLYGVLGHGVIEVSLHPFILTVDLSLYFYLLLAGVLLNGLSPAWDLVQSYREKL